MKPFFAAAACFVGLLTSALADEVAPIVHSLPNIGWNGYYVGVQAGGVRQRTSTIYSNGADFLLNPIFVPTLANGTLARLTSANSSGALGGFTVGYNFQSARFIYGIESDFGWVGVKAMSSATPKAAFPYPTLTSTTEMQTDWLATIRGRVGLLAAPQTSVFVTGGLALGGVKTTTSIVPSGACPVNAFCSNGSESGIKVGWAVGVGAEQQLGANWSLKIEYLHYDLGRLENIVRESSAAFPTIAGQANLIATTKMSNDVGRIGLNYRF